MKFDGVDLSTHWKHANKYCVQQWFTAEALGRKHVGQISKQANMTN